MLYNEKLKPRLDELKNLLLIRYEEAERLADLIRHIEYEAKCEESLPAEYFNMFIRSAILSYEDCMRDSKFHTLDADEAKALVKLKQTNLE